MNLKPSTENKSCDTCYCQHIEDKRYCDLHDEYVYNMDIVVCDDWTDNVRAWDGI